MVRKACEYRADAREILRDNWGNAVVFTLVVDLIASVVSLIPEVGSIIALFFDTHELELCSSIPGCEKEWRKV